MKYLGFIFFLLILIVGSWPYVGLYQLSDALVANDQAAMNKMVDIDSVRTNHKKAIAQQVNDTVGGGDNPLSNMMREGARAIGGAAVDVSVDMAWVRETLQNEQSLFSATSFAFFESPTRFLVRIGNLGNDPVHLYMTLQDWNWRVTAIYN